MLKTGKNRKETGKMEGGEIPLGDEPLPSLTSPEERKKIVATCLALCWVLFINPFIFPNMLQEKYYLPIINED